MQSDSEFEGSTPVKKSRQSELRLSEAFKSEYAREFADDMIKVSFNNLFYFKTRFRHRPKATDSFIVAYARKIMKLGREEKFLSLVTLIPRLIKMQKKQKMRRRQ